ncbi:MAG: carboxypeptidase-like regulatory domain-containing protein, partial [Calditrichia bacterium]|nr:carboxypeptidase-like regulatory domain-containing protein [Calditrichia bacterium]
MRILSILLIFFVMFSSFLLAGTTGKIAGLITDASTGEPLPGVNITVEETFLGAATDLDGYYVILNLPPGKFTISAQFIGYSTSIIQEVRINIDQTTRLDFELKEEALEVGETIVVIADRPVVEMDVA